MNLLIESVEQANNDNSDRLYREAVEQGTGPGKFEGEGVETRYFYLRMMDGDGDTIYSNEFSGESFTILDVNEYERGLFSMDSSTVAFELYESPQGFVCGRALTEEEEAKVVYGRALTEEEEAKANELAESLYEQEQELSENSDDGI